MVLNCKKDFMRALEHHHMTLQPHHTCHIMIHVISFPLSLMNSFDINSNHTQHKGEIQGHHTEALIQLRKEEEYQTS